MFTSCVMMFVSVEPTVGKTYCRKSYCLKARKQNNIRFRFQHIFNILEKYNKPLISLIFLFCHFHSCLLIHPCKEIFAFVTTSSSSLARPPFLIGTKPQLVAFCDWTHPGVTPSGPPLYVQTKACSWSGLNTRFSS